MKLSTSINVARLRVSFVAKSDSRLMRLIGRLAPAFMSSFWTTMRLPFCDPVIFYPANVDDPESMFQDWIVQHELVHVEDLAPWYGPLKIALLYFLIPLPFIFSGRWFAERHAYLLDIKNGYRTPETAAESLWDGYAWPWPQGWMIDWFDEQLEADARD